VFKKQTSKYFRTFIAFSLLSTLVYFTTSNSNAVTVGVRTDGGTTLQVDLATSQTIAANATSVVFNFSSNIRRPSTNWSDSDLIAVEVALTAGTGDTAGSDTAPVDRTAGCRVDLSSSTSSGVFGSSAVPNTVFVLNDYTQQVSLQGTIQNVVDALQFVQVSCTNASDLVGKYVRVGAVPTIGSATCTDTSNDGVSVTCSNLFYVFSTNHYYRVVQAASARTIAQFFTKAANMTIPVNGRTKTDSTIHGWVSTLTTRDEILVTNATYLSAANEPRMIGTTDSGATWNWNNNWGTRPTGVAATCTTEEGGFRWLGPDNWCELVPSYNLSGGVARGSTSQYWRLSNGLWEHGTLESHTINFGSATRPASPFLAANAVNTNGYNVYHSWHTPTNSAPSEPNFSGDFIYQGYSSGADPGWDDAGESDGGGGEPSGPVNQVSFTVEFCSGTTNNTCTPEDDAVDSIQLKYDQTISISTAPAEGASETNQNNTFTASTTSGLVLSFASGDTSVCTVSSASAASGTSVTVTLLTSNANCAITVSQAGDTNYNPATSVTRTFLSLFGRIVSCSGVGALQNGGFENLPVTTSNVATSQNNSTDYVWHGYVNPTYYAEPRQFLFLGSANSNKTTKISSWNSSIVGSDDGVDEGWVEIQRQVSNYAHDGTASNVEAYWDKYNPSPAEGDYFAELNAKVEMGLYQDISTIPGTTIRWSIKHRGRSFFGADVMKVKIGSTSSQSEQTSLQRKLQDSSNLWGTPTYNNNSFTNVSTISDELATGWTIYTGSYTVPAGQTTSRFIFESVSGDIAASIGNFLDDIIFSPLIACPATFTVVKGRTVDLNPFDLDNDGSGAGADTDGSSFGWNDAFVSSTGLSASAGSVSRTTFGGVSNRAIRYVAPSTTGQQTIDFTITNPQGDTSSSRMTINVVEEASVRNINSLPIDPQATSYSLRSFTIDAGPEAVLACINSASDSSGTISNSILVFDVGNIGTTDTTYTISPNTVTITGDRSDNMTLTGSLSAVNSIIGGLQVTRVGGTRFTSNQYVRIRSVPSVTVGQLNCANALASADRTLTLRPLELTRTKSAIVTVN
jgi:hypothetical protein